jgi:putative Mg2+ transporter-C (MgtC) family protein
VTLTTQGTTGATAETQARILQGLLSGIGFIGGGAILKDKGEVRGLAIAASIWSTAAIGVAVAYQREEIAVVLGIITFLLLRVLTSVITSTSSSANTGEQDLG